MGNIDRELCMWHKWAAVVGVLVQQYGLPKSVHFVEVLWPAVLDNVVEDGR